MSSILDALKKLEAEKEDTEQEFVWGQPVNTRLALSGSLAPSRLKSRFLIGVGIAVFIIASVIFLLSGTEKNNESATVKGTSSEPVEISDKAVHAADVKAEAVPFGETVARPPSTEKNFYESDAVYDEQVEQTASASSNDLENLTKLVSRKKSSGLFESKPSTEEKNDSDKAAQTEAFNKKASELIQKLPKDLIPPEKTVPANWLTLHAISWSSDPSSRIAVINSQIVREGRRVEGGYVKRIDKDYVVIEKDGEDMMLPFGR